jgi:hypothetical protein
VQQINSVQWINDDVGEPEVRNVDLRPAIGGVCLRGMIGTPFQHGRILAARKPMPRKGYAN